MSTLNPLDIVPRMVDGLAVYDLGHGAGQEEPVLLLPSPTEPDAAQRARHRLALLLVRLGKRVITFDPADEPGGEIAPLLRHARHCLDLHLIDDPIDVVADGHAGSDADGHADGHANALAVAFAQSYPDRVRRLVMVGSPPEVLIQTVPTLLYVNESDPTAVAQAQTLAALHPDCRLEISAHGSQRPFDTNPVHFGSVLRDFLAPGRPAPFKPISVEL